MSETPADYFEDLWAASADPWDHAGRWYETRKYDLTVAALPAARATTTPSSRRAASGC